MLIPVEIASFALDPERNLPLVILKSTVGEQILTIPIDPVEAGVIAVKSMNVPSEIPHTIDLVKSLLDAFNSTLLKVVFHAIVEGQPVARLIIQNAGGIMGVEARPSDALAMAVKCACPMFVDDSVFAALTPSKEASSQERLKTDIATMDTLSFGTCHLE